MKIIFCRTCNDFFRMTRKIRYCICGESFGAYNEDGDTVTVSEGTIVMGINNGFMARMKVNYPDKSEGDIWNFSPDYDKIFVSSNPDQIGGSEHFINPPKCPHHIPVTEFCAHCTAIIYTERMKANG